MRAEGHPSALLLSQDDALSRDFCGFVLLHGNAPKYRPSFPGLLLPYIGRGTPIGVQKRKNHGRHSYPHGIGAAFRADSCHQSLVSCEKSATRLPLSPRVRRARDGEGSSRALSWGRSGCVCVRRYARFAARAALRAAFLSRFSCFLAALAVFLSSKEVSGLTLRLRA